MRLLIPPVYSLTGIRAYDEVQIAVTEVRQVRRLQACQSKGLSSFPGPSVWYLF